MYLKNLNEDLRLRLSTNDMNFLRGLSDQRGVTVSEVIRSIIGEYRRSLEMVNTLQQAIELTRNSKGGTLSNGDTKTDINS